MTKHEAIQAELKEAMKARDVVRLRTIRSILTALTNELVASGKTPRDTLDDDATLAVIKRLAKQRKDSIEQYEAADRSELAEPEKEELLVLEAYLPRMMTQDEIRPIAQAKLTELDITDKSKMGVAIGAVMKDLGGAADGADVKVIIEELLS